MYTVQSPPITNSPTSATHGARRNLRPSSEHALIALWKFQPIPARAYVTRRRAERVFEVPLAAQSSGPSAFERCASNRMLNRARARLTPLVSHHRSLALRTSSLRQPSPWPAQRRALRCPGPFGRSLRAPAGDIHLTCDTNVGGPGSRLPHEDPHKVQKDQTTGVSSRTPDHWLPGALPVRRRRVAMSRCPGLVRTGLSI